MRAHRLITTPLACVLSWTLVGNAYAQSCPPSQVFFPHQDVAAGNYPLAAAVGRFDSDGHLDLAVAALENSRLLIYRGLGNGSFTAPLTIGLGQPSNLVTSDFNGDGNADLAVTRFPNQLTILLGDGLGGFGIGDSYTVGSNPRGVAVGDFDQDGIKDLAVASESAVFVFRGQGTSGVGDGTFASPLTYTAPSAWGVATGDFNSDGITDLVIANGVHAQLTILRGLGFAGVGNGTFASQGNVAVPNGQREVLVADFNQDGIDDIATSSPLGISVLRGQGTGGVGNMTFALTNYPVIASSNSIVTSDFTGDGILDLIASDPGATRVALLPGLGSSGVGNGTFGTADYYVKGNGCVGLALGDFNEDLKTDVIVTNVAANTISWLAGRCGPVAPSAPVISAVGPFGGRVGDRVWIVGAQLNDPTSVDFNGVAAEILSATFYRIETRVPVGATTGPVHVTTSNGTAASPANFFIGDTPVVDAADPDHGGVGTVVTITGQQFTSTTHVSFGGASSAAFVVDSDVQIRATVDALAVTGPISVTNPLGTGQGSFDFVVDPLQPAPAIVAVRDVPNDQGGRVTIAWKASEMDIPEFHKITGYRVWRRAPGFAARMAPPPGARSAVPTSETDADFWESLVTLPAAFLEGYAFVASTTQDSIEGSNPYTAFFVQALTADAFTFYNSSVDSAYSIDNLSPAQPSPFTAVYAIGPGVALHWAANRASDLFGYRLHRGIAPSFIPTETNLVFAAPDTGYFDPTGSMYFYYKLSALDVHGNQSRFALVGPDRPTATLAVLVDRSIEPGSVRLVWDVSGEAGARATIYRRTADGEWSVATSAIADGQGRIEFRDTTVEPGRRYGYRLGVMDAGVETFAAEIWIDVPSFTLALERLRPNPIVSADLELGLQLAGSHAHLDVFDVRGRRVLSRDFSPASSGRFSFVLPTRGMAAGVYLVRLQQDDRTESAKFVILQ